MLCRHTDIYLIITKLMHPPPPLWLQVEAMKKRGGGGTPLTRGPSFGAAGGAGYAIAPGGGIMLAWADTPSPASGRADEAPGQAGGPWGLGQGYGPGQGQGQGAGQWQGQGQGPGQGRGQGGQQGPERWQQQQQGGWMQGQGQDQGYDQGQGQGYGQYEQRYGQGQGQGYGQHGQGFGQGQGHAGMAATFDDMVAELDVLMAQQGGAGRRGVDGGVGPGGGVAVAWGAEGAGPWQNLNPDQGPGGWGLGAGQAPGYPPQPGADPGFGVYPGGSPQNPNDPIMVFRQHKFTTAAEMDAKARQQAEHREALERQIMEKKMAKEQVSL